MAIKVGDTIPDIQLKQAGPNGLTDISTGRVLGIGKVVLFAVPGAYTPTCTSQHLPGYIEHAASFQEKGVLTIACLAVNDPFVMKAWAEDTKAGNHVYMIPDGNAEFTRAIGMEIDLSAACLGTRSKRYAMIIKDGVVEHIEIEEKPGECSVSSAPTILSKIVQ